MEIITFQNSTHTILLSVDDSRKIHYEGLELPLTQHNIKVLARYEAGEIEEYRDEVSQVVLER